MIAALVAIFGCFTIGSAFGQAPSCSCSFKETPWEAYGTKAGCTTITRKGGTSCEIEFGGVSTDPKVAAQVLGLDPAKYLPEAYDVLEQYIRYLRDNKREALADRKFLSIALPIFMRGAYLRRSFDDRDASLVKSLDATVQSFLEKYSDDVSKVFSGSAKGFSIVVNDANFVVGRGYITVSHSYGLIITRYMPSE
jgi:hypothetical protein